MNHSTILCGGARQRTTVRLVCQTLAGAARPLQPGMVILERCDCAPEAEESLVEPLATCSMSRWDGSFKLLGI